MKYIVILLLFYFVLSQNTNNNENKQTKILQPKCKDVFERYKTIKPYFVLENEIEKCFILNKPLGTLIDVSYQLRKLNSEELVKNNEINKFSLKLKFPFDTIINETDILSTLTFKNNGKIIDEKNEKNQIRKVLIINSDYDYNLMFQMKYKNDHEICFNIDSKEDENKFKLYLFIEDGIIEDTPDYLASNTTMNSLIQEFNASINVLKELRNMTLDEIEQCYEDYSNSQTIKRRVILFSLIQIVLFVCVACLYQRNLYNFFRKIKVI